MSDVRVNPWIISIPFFCHFHFDRFFRLLIDLAFQSRVTKQETSCEVDRQSDIDGRLTLGE